MQYRTHYEEKFRKYQAILADCAEDEDSINLEEITKDFCEIDEWGRISVRCIPTKGDNVFFTIRTKPVGEDGEKTDIIVPLSQISEKQLNNLVELMRKAMIIEELRNTYIKDETD